MPLELKILEALFLDQDFSFCYIYFVFLKLKKEGVMKEKILIFGRKGWLAKRFNEFFENSEISDVDITDLKAD